MKKRKEDKPRDEEKRRGRQLPKKTGKEGNICQTNDGLDEEEGKKGRDGERREAITRRKLSEVGPLG